MCNVFVIQDAGGESSLPTTSLSHKQRAEREPSETSEQRPCLARREELILVPHPT